MGFFNKLKKKKQDSLLDVPPPPTLEAPPSPGLDSPPAPDTTNHLSLDSEDEHMDKIPELKPPMLKQDDDDLDDTELDLPPLPKPDEAPSPEPQQTKDLSEPDIPPISTNELLESGSGHKDALFPELPEPPKETRLPFEHTNVFPDEKELSETLAAPKPPAALAVDEETVESMPPLPPEIQPKLPFEHFDAKDFPNRKELEEVYKQKLGGQTKIPRPERSTAPRLKTHILTEHTNHFVSLTELRFVLSNHNEIMMQLNNEIDTVTRLMSIHEERGNRCARFQEDLEDCFRSFEKLDSLVFLGDKNGNLE